MESYWKSANHCNRENCFVINRCWCFQNRTIKCLPPWATEYTLRTLCGFTNHQMVAIFCVQFEYSSVALLSRSIYIVREFVWGHVQAKFVIRYIKYQDVLCLMYSIYLYINHTFMDRSIIKCDRCHRKLSGYSHSTWVTIVVAVTKDADKSYRIMRNSTQYFFFILRMCLNCSQST